MKSRRPNLFSQRSIRIVHVVSIFCAILCFFGIRIAILAIRDFQRQCKARHEAVQAIKRSNGLIHFKPEDPTNRSGLRIDVIPWLFNPQADSTRQAIDSIDLSEEGKSDGMLIYIGRILELKELDLSPLLIDENQSLFSSHSQEFRQEARCPGYPISNKALFSIRGLRHLLRLNLSGTRITDDGLVHIKSLNSLRELRLCHTAVTNAGLLPLQGLSRLRLLDLSGTLVDDLGLVRLKSFPDLRVLYLGNTAVSNSGLASLRSLTRLQILDLSFTLVDDIGLRQLEDLKTLRSVDVSHTNVTDFGILSLKRAIPSVKIIFSSLNAM